MSIKRQSICYLSNQLHSLACYLQRLERSRELGLEAWGELEQLTRRAWSLADRRRQDRRGLK